MILHTHLQRAMPFFQYQKVILTAIFFGLAIMVLVSWSVPYQGGWSLLLSTFFHYDPSDYQQLIVHLTYLPRIIMALLCGFSLAVAGCVMQYVLRNPIASPTTLGVATGAQMGMMLGLLLLPASIFIPSFIPAFVGGLLATFLVFWLGAKRGLAPVHLVLSGMVTNLFLGAINTMLLLIYEQQLTSVFIWGSGSLNQNGWESIHRLLPLIVIATTGLFALSRPLSSLQLGDGVANSLGINVKRIKLLSLTLAVFMTAAVVSEVGLIGFVGLVAPAVARLLGARKLTSQIIFSGLIGSSLLLLADLIVQPISGAGGDLLPTGAMTALFGAPFFLWLLGRQVWQSHLNVSQEPANHYQSRRFLPTSLWLFVVLCSVFAIALWVGKDNQGWTFAINQTLIDLRMPRLFSAMFAGIGLAIAGTLIQRMTGNAMASPEVLGMSSGSALALVLFAFSGLTVTRYEQIAIGTLGALLVTAFLWWMGRRHHFAPLQLLLTGIAVSAGLDAILKIALATGGDNVKSLLTWLSGSTYLVSSSDASILALGVLLLGGLSLVVSRWLNIIELGAVTASSLGMDCRKVRAGIIMLVAALTTLCTVMIGPLTFIGLLAPHMARSLHQYTAHKQLVVACLLGAIVMMFSDWIGRVLWFPWQFPAGLLSSILGGGYFLYLMRRHTLRR